MDTGKVETSESGCGKHDQQHFSVLLRRLGLSEDTKLTMMDGRIFIEHSKNEEVLLTDIVPLFFQDISANDHKAAKNLQENYKKVENGDIVSSRDLMFAILTCCDNFLRQDMLHKLVSCNIAVPVLLPDERNKNVTFLLWGLRQCNGLLFDAKTNNYEEINLTKYPFMTISAIRFGEVNISKSDILNSLVKSWHGLNVNDSFLSLRFDTGVRIYSLGTVEWLTFVPSDKSATSLPISLLNLRGDASKYEKQLSFCCKNSQIVIVFSELPPEKSVERNLRRINPLAHIIIVLPSSAKNVECKGDGVSVVKFKENSPQHAIARIMEITLEKHKNADAFSLQSFDEIKLSCNDVGILVDEEFEKCDKAKSAVLELSVAIGDSGHVVKKDLFPLQDVWREWVTSGKEKLREDREEARQMEMEIKLRELRKKQSEVIMSNTMLKFMTIFFESDKEFVNYFLIWLQIVLKEKSFKTLKPSIDRIKAKVIERRTVYDKVRFLRSPQTDSWPLHRKKYQLYQKKEEKETINEQEYKELKNYDATVFAQEDYVREIGQMFECNRSTNLGAKQEMHIKDMVTFAVDLLINGHSIELVPNEMGCVALRWMRAIFKRLHTTLNNKPTIRVISVIGGPSSGKSHLLNCTFGTKFTEGDGRCSRGVHLALVPLHDKTQKLIKCDFLIIADTESVNVSEKTVPDILKKNNFISTLVSCISDVVIVKIGKENTPEENTGIFNITLRGLQTSIDVDEVVQACIVQSFNNEQKQPKRRDVEQKLTEVIENLAKKEQDSNKQKQLQHNKIEKELLECFVFSSDETEKVKNINFLFTPDTHCLLKDNERHSSDVKTFRATVTQMLTKCSKNPRFFTEFGEHVEDVIQSIESGNFIQAFETATFRKRCDAFLFQCEQTLSTIQGKLSERIVQVSSKMINAFNDGKSMEEVKSLEERVLNELSELAISDVHNLLRKISTESIQKYFQPFLKDIETIKTKVELFRSTQLEQMHAQVKETITDINRYANSVTNFNNKLSDTETELGKTFTQSCDELCTAEHGKIESRVKQYTHELTKQLNDKLQMLSDELKTIECNEFKIHFESVKENFNLVSSTYRTKVIDVLQKRANEVNGMFNYMFQFEKQLAEIQTELSDKLSKLSLELGKENDNVDDTLHQKIREIEKVAQSTFDQIQSEMQDSIDIELFPHVRARLTEKRRVAYETCIEDARKQLKTSADRVKETKALQILTDSLKKKKERKKYVLQFNIVLTKIQQELEAKLITFCRIIMGATMDNIDEVWQFKDKEFKEIASDKFNALLNSTLEERGKSFEQKEYISFEKSSKSVEKHLLSKMSKQLKETADKAKDKKKQKEKVRLETNKFLETVKEDFQTQHDNSKVSIQNKFETKFKPFLSTLKKLNPLPSISILKRKKETELLSEVKELINIPDNELPTESELSDYASTFSNVQSKEDVAKITKDFCSVNERNEKDFNHLITSLSELSKDFVNFEQNADKFVSKITQFEANSTLFVERVSLFSFLCSKFISNTHEMHMRAELKSIQKHKPKTENQPERFQKVSGKEQVLTKAKVKQTEYDHIECTQPIKFASVDSKVKHICAILVNLKEKAIAETLSTTTVKNYSNLPLTMKTVKRLDSCFMRLLPPLKAEDMLHLYETVNDAKLAIIGKTMAKVSYSCQQFFSEISEAANNSTLGREKNDKVNAAALTHLSAWSANLMAVKELEETKETNVAIAVEQKERSCLISVYKQCDHSCDELIADEVCRQVENSLEDCIEENFVMAFTKELATKCTDIGLKKAFIGTMLKSFLQNNENRGYLQFVNNFNKLCDNWTLTFLANDCNKESESVIAKLNNNVIHSIIEVAITAARKTKSVFGVKTDKKIKTWLNLFENFFNEKSNTVLILDIEDILDTEGGINDPCIFSEECIERLSGLKDKFQNKRELPEKGNVDATRTWLLSFSNDIHVEMSKFIKGCTEQCPFCGHPCDQDLCEHDFHETSIHIPRGLKGSKGTNTGVLTASICNAAVQKGTGKFKVKDIEGVWKDYRKTYPEWKISGNENDCIPFWKYIFLKYNLEFSKYYECQAGHEEEWGDVDENEALGSLHDTYLNELSKNA